MTKLIATPLGFVLSFLYNLTGHYWIAIVVLSVVIRFAMYPLYKKQIMSTAGMSELQPKMQEIQRKYANDKETMNQKLAELQRESGFNPMAGCFPTIVQMIIITGLFGLLRYPLNYISDESIVFGAHETFLWIKDLSQPDPWILPILSGIATFFSFSMSQQNNLNSAQGANGMMNTMKYVFPIMILWIARTYPAGLAIYWFISQFTQIFFNIRFSKLRKELNSKKDKKSRKGAKKATA